MSGTEPWPDPARFDPGNPQDDQGHQHPHGRQNDQDRQRDDDATGPLNRGEAAWGTPTGMAAGWTPPAGQDPWASQSSWAPGAGQPPTSPGPATGGWAPTAQDPLFGTRDPVTGGYPITGPATSADPRTGPPTTPTGSYPLTRDPWTSPLTAGTGGHPSTGGSPHTGPATDPATGGLGPATGGMPRLGPATGGLGRPRPGLPPLPAGSTTGSFATGQRPREWNTEPVSYVIDPATGGHRVPAASPGDENSFGGSRADDEHPDDATDYDTNYGDTNYDDTDYDDDTDYEAEGAPATGRFGRASARVRGSRFASRRWSDDPGDDDTHGDSADDLDDDSDGQASGGHGGGGRRAGSGKKKRKPLIGWRRAVAVFVVALILGLIYRAMSSTPDHGGSTAATTPTASAVPADFLQSAATDSDPVTADEFFRSAQFAAGTHTYVRLAHQLDTGCPKLTGLLALGLAGQVTAAPAASAPPTTAAAASGAVLGAPSAKSSTTPAAQPTGPICRQLARALYAGEPDANGRRVFAGVAVLVLDTTSRTTQAVKALKARAGGVASLPLPAGALPGAKVSVPNGDHSLRAVFADGHYAIVIDLTYSDGIRVAPTDGVLSDAAADLHEQILAPLDSRLLFGHGYRG